MEILELVHQETTLSLERPFECTFNDCKKTFGTFFKKKMSLNQQVINPPKSLGRRSDLVRHSRIHTNER